MKRLLNGLRATGILLLLMFVCSLHVQAAEDARAANGIRIGGVDISGMTQEEALKAVNAYMTQAKAARITLHGADDTQAVELTAGDLGLRWSNPEIASEAVEFGKAGNIVRRYKTRKELQAGGKTYALQLSLNHSDTIQLLEEKCVSFNTEAADFSLTRSGGTFQITEGRTGREVDTAASAAAIENVLTNGWDGRSTDVDLVIRETEPKGSYEMLSRVRDVLGTFTTSYTSSGASRSQNIANGCKLINDTTLYPGEEFSALAAITPFTEANGYELAGSYLNGTVVESFGGGICQVSTTLYNAVLRAELQVTDRSNHSMIVNYVDPSEDAAIAENGGKDFKFVNNLDTPVYIEGYVADKHITFTIYGEETRPSGRRVSFESEVLEKTVPDTVNFITSSAQPIGYVHTEQAAHTGYKAKLWKIVTVNGTEESRDVVNQSTYRAVPKTVTVGTGGSSDPNIQAQLSQAIASGDEATVRAAAGSLASLIAAPPALTPEEQALLEYQ